MTAPAETLLHGRYRVTGELGAGSQGETLDAVDERSKRRVAIKRFTVRGASSWKDVELAEREARVLRSLSHPALPAYVDHFEEGGCLYLVMERIDGEDLARARARGARLTPTAVTRLLREIGAALDYLHQLSPPVIHRDVKPSNVLRRPDGSFCLVDFGSVRDRARPAGGSTVVGTFGYMAPEQFQGRALPASDLYGLGATILTLVTGVEPEEQPHRGLGIDVRAALGSSAEPRLVETLRAMLEPDPDRRAARAAPLIAELEATAAPPGRSPAAPDRPPEARARDGQLGDDLRAAAEAARSVREALRREARRRQRGRVPGRRGRRRAAHPLLLALGWLLLTLAPIAIWAALMVALPALLTLASLGFGERARRAARGSRALGERLNDGLRRSRRVLRELGEAAHAEEPPRVRVESAPPPGGPRRRVVGPDEVEARGDEPDELERPPARRRAPGE
ncbi:MAG: serine/threonine-protein kinase [Sorangiineae bacterium]|nr:serine/threonine-protein kinase [Polyangiaceae bacterium]MEB2323655.1 serine/threonine-protein kinase [Sorangiineae bacterium]